MSEYATAEDFKEWAFQAKLMTVDQLVHAAKDCREAADAMKGWNPQKESYYRDQGMTFSDALRKKIKK